jgi:hypothetical protein
MDTGYMISTKVQIDVSDQPVMCGFTECKPVTSEPDFPNI